jgi:hypothetical protein
MLRTLLLAVAALAAQPEGQPECGNPVNCFAQSVKQTAAAGVEVLRENADSQLDKLEAVAGPLGGAVRAVRSTVENVAQIATGTGGSEPWVPKNDDFVIVVQNTLRKEHVGRSGQIIKMGSAQIKKKGQVLVEYEPKETSEVESKETEWYRYPKSWLRKMTSEEVTEYLKKYPEKAPRPPDAPTQPPRPTLAPASPQEMETCGKKAFDFIKVTGFASAGGKSSLFKNPEQSLTREIIEPEKYDEKALVRLIQTTDQMLVFAKPGRKRRPETLRDAIGSGDRAVKVSGAELVEMLCGNDGLYEEAQKLPANKKCENCLRSEEAKRRIAEAEALAEEAAAQKQLASEPQIEIDIYVVRGGHETGDWTTDGSIEKKSSHGDAKCSFYTGYCVPGRKSYEYFAVQCDEIEAAFMKSAGGVVPAAEKLVPVFFEQENVRRFARRGYLTDGVTGRAKGAVRCRAGTKSCSQMGP